MLYHAYEMTHAAISPMRAAARMGQEVISNPLNPMAITFGSRAMSAALEMFINVTKRYGKPAFGIDSVVVDGVETPVVEDIVWSAPFCNLLHFRRDTPAAARAQRSEGADRRADVGPLCDAAPRHGPRHAARPRGLHHRLDRCARGAARGRRLRPRRLHRSPCRDDRVALRRGRANRGDGRLPARHPGDGGREPDGDGGQPASGRRRWC